MYCNLVLIIHVSEESIPPFSEILKLESTDSSEAFITIYQRRQTSENSNFDANIRLDGPEIRRRLW
jgi:hypothetical protein